MIVGITGNIGSGKSVVCQLLRLLGYPVFDMDQAAKYLMNHSEFLKTTLSNLFGEETYRDGELNRKYLASIIFSDESALKKMNGIVHPCVEAYFKEWVSEQRHSILFFESAILFESGLNRIADEVWTVTAPEELCMKRAMNRDSASYAQVKARIDAQMSNQEKCMRAQRVVINDDMHAVMPQLFHFIKELQNTLSSEMIQQNKGGCS